ncbi:hypothetical protein FZ103_14415 [Streptomonospora sp. PA3]|uniref:nuclear transport factor 2 family protein n=1 Tax=Streptomonospora sp. PA3 TaxID=2607326 RepID=UPI0012DFB195|nr:nuclear transport factor 2 family protein [Streptomonospora sp. PA3]MUL42358.1 hypothetical protein [Streptomonospora sp. PA3]
MSTATGTGPLDGPAEAFARFRSLVLANDGAGFTGDMLAEDVLVEFPFAPEGGVRDVRGREAFLRFARAGRAALPVRFTGVHDVTLHETADPEVAVAEYSLAAEHVATGRTLRSAFAMVLRVRDGRIVHCREYQNAAAMAAALT